MITNQILLQAAGNGNGAMNILMIVLLFVIFYFFLIRPQQKRQKEIKKFRNGLQKGSDVITAGGIYGKIKDINGTTALISIADNVVVKVDINSIYPNAVAASELTNNK